MEVHEDHDENDDERRVEDEENKKKNYFLMVHYNIRYTYRGCLVYKIGRQDRIKLSYPVSICCLVRQ